MKKYYLWLLQIMNIANPRSLKIIDYYGDIKKAYESITNGDYKLLKQSEIAALPSCTLENSQEIIAKCEDSGIEIITLEDELYPFNLKNIHNPPIVLFVKGDISMMNNTLCLTGVGARDCSEYSQKLCSKICRDLTFLGTTLVSGLAIGIDAAVHAAAVYCKAPTIGVMACGINTNYPRQNEQLKLDILKYGGAIISESLPDTESRKGNFHARNRILSGLSKGTIVFEASMRSGSLITANYAVEQDRDLFCVTPANVFEKRYAGVVPLLRDGAIAVYNHFDIIREYENIFTSNVEEIKQRLLEEKTLLQKQTETLINLELTEEKEDTIISYQKNEITMSNATNKQNLELSEDEQKIVNYLRGKTVHIDKIAKDLELQHLELCDILLDLEIRGIVKACPGGQYKA